MGLYHGCGVMRPPYSRQGRECLSARRPALCEPLALCTAAGMLLLCAKTEGLWCGKLAEARWLTVVFLLQEVLLPLSLGCADPAPLTRGATA